MITLLRFAAVTVAAFSAAACAELAPPPPSAPTSGYASSIGAPSTPSGSDFAGFRRGNERADLVVRPDAIRILFAFKDKSADAPKAIEGIRAAVASLDKRVREVASAAKAGTVTVTMCGVSITAAGSSKLAGEDVPELAILADGRIDLGLPAELDYWARIRLLSSLTQATGAIVAASSKSGPRVHFDAPTAMVKDPEAYRARLTDQWAKRAKALAEAIQGAAAPLSPVDCVPPAPIEQKVISLEEVGLMLPMTCKLDAPRIAK